MTDALFTPDQLRSLPDCGGATDDQAALAELIVWGWVSDATGLDTRPSTVTSDLFAWAIELGGIAYRNGETRSQVGQVSSMHANDDARRNEILARVSAASDVGTQLGAPQGCFPPAQCWPDPILVAPVGPPYADARDLLDQLGLG